MTRLNNRTKYVLIILVENRSFKIPNENGVSGTANVPLTLCYRSAISTANNAANVERTEKPKSLPDTWF